MRSMGERMARILLEGEMQNEFLVFFRLMEEDEVLFSNISS